MRWYVNDASLQRQFHSLQEFETSLVSLLAIRERIALLRGNLRSTRTLPERFVSSDITFRRAIQQSRDSVLRSKVLLWVDRGGPFVEDDQLSDENDYFEYLKWEVTYTGLGEAARRVKARQEAATYSFAGVTEFEKSPLSVDHGLSEDRLGQYDVQNFWTIAQLEASAIEHTPSPTSWKSLVEGARERFPFLTLPNSIFKNEMLSREPFDTVIRDRVFNLLSLLNQYMSDRSASGAEGARAKEIIQTHFTGERALFTAESSTNQNDFRKELTFSDPDNQSLRIFAHWHGKISHRYFRMHFEWPIPQNAKKLKVVYIGPKITKD